MVYPGLRKWAVQNNWKIGKNSIYGEYNGYYFTAFDGKNQKCFATALPFLNDSQKEKILEDLNKNKKTIHLSEVALDNSTLRCMLKEVLKPLKQEEMKQFLDHVTKLLKEQEVPGIEKCCNCGREGSYEMALVNEFPVSMCPECFDSAREESLQAEQEFERTEKNYLLGLIGALAGGLIASVPWIILSYFGWLAAILGFVIGKVSLKGYQMLGGRLGNATRWIIMGSTAFSIVFAEVVAYVIAIMVTYKIPFAVEIIYFVLTTPEVIQDMMPNILLGWFMGFLGIFQLFKAIKQEVDSSVIKVEKA